MQNTVKIIKLLYTKENEARGKQKSTNNSKTCRFRCVIICLCVDQMSLNIFHSSVPQLHQIPLSLHYKQNASKVQESLQNGR